MKTTFLKLSKKMGASHGTLGKLWRKLARFVQSNHPRVAEG